MGNQETDVLDENELVGQDDFSSIFTKTKKLFWYQ